MPMNKEQIIAAALALPPDERRQLAMDLYQSIPTEPADRPRWRDELRDLAAEIDRGDVPLVPAEEALRRLRERTRA